MYKILTLNNIAVDIPKTVVAIGRAGAGTNNIPIEQMSARGVPVFNAPGANANAVKELVIAGLLMAARNLCDAREHVKALQETGSALNKAVEVVLNCLARRSALSASVRLASKWRM